MAAILSVVGWETIEGIEEKSHMLKCQLEASCCI